MDITVDKLSADARTCKHREHAGDCNIYQLGYLQLSCLALDNSSKNDVAPKGETYGAHSRLRQLYRFKQAA